MSDTPPEVRKRFREMMLARSPIERMRMGSEMLDSARAMVLASLPAGMPEGERRAALFLRFYSRDFDEPERARILEALRAGPDATGAPGPNESGSGATREG
jgi:hypothetical protein